MRVGKILTGTKDLGEDALLVCAVDVVGCLALLVGLVEQTAIFRVPQEQFGQLSAPTPDGNVQRCVSFLKARHEPIL